MQNGIMENYTVAINDNTGGYIAVGMLFLFLIVACVAGDRSGDNG